MRINKNDKSDFNIPNDFNMKCIEQDLKLNIYKIRYTYKGNIKENHKYLIADVHVTLEWIYEKLHVDPKDIQKWKEKKMNRIEKELENGTLG